MRGRTWAVALASVLATAVMSESGARAQEPSASQPVVQPSPEALPPDIVKLKNGSLYRGAIMELVAGDHVDVRLPSGETKRFPMGDVDYAGPASGAPGTTPAPSGLPAPPAPTPARSTPSPLVTIEGKAARVHFEAKTSETDFHIRTQDVELEGGGFGWGMRGGLYGFASSSEGHGYARICVAPCDATLPVGKYRLALSQEGKKPVEADGAVEIPGPSTVYGTYVSNRATRTAGWVILGVSVAAGLGLMIAGAAHQDCQPVGSGFGSSTSACTSDPDTGLVAAGSVVTIVGALLSLAFTLQHDRAEITVEPE